jgi:hypothetical protein
MGVGDDILFICFCFGVQGLFFVIVLGVVLVVIV